MSVAARLRRTPPGYRFSIGRILVIYAGLMVTLLLAALDQTIVATALPRIVSDLGGLTSYTWVFTAYLLTSTVTVPIWGKLGDVHGRRPLILLAIGIFLVGSLLCGLAQSMAELVVFRGVQGIGAGGLLPLVIATVGNIVPPADRGRYQGLIGAVFAAASILGPALGGFIVDNFSWNWIFLVNLPVGGVALGVVWFTMPRRGERHHRHSIDWTGAGLLAFGTAALLLALVWAGRDYPWLSWPVGGAFATAAVLLLAFAVTERRAVEPILPFELLRIRSVSASVTAAGLLGMAMFGAITFVPLFAQGVIGVSAASSGAVLTPFMFGAVITSIAAGQFVARTGRYRPLTLIGPVILGSGLFLLSRLGVDATTGEVARDMAICGIGLGLMMQTFVLIVQNAVPSSSIGSGTALTQFSRSIGATLGVAIMGLIVNQGLPPEARRQGQLLHRLPMAGRVALANALQPAFLAAAAVCLVVLLIAFFGISEVPLRRGFEERAGGVDSPS